MMGAPGTWRCVTWLHRTEVLPLADVLTPNQFEAEILSGQSLTHSLRRKEGGGLPSHPCAARTLAGIKIRSEADAQRACLWLHARGPRTVVITSAALADRHHDQHQGQGQGQGQLYVLGSSRTCHAPIALGFRRMDVQPHAHTHTGAVSGCWKSLQLCRLLVPRLPGSYTGRCESQPGGVSWHVYT
jgi:hypothetical protein